MTITFDAETNSGGPGFDPSWTHTGGTPRGVIVCTNIADSDSPAAVTYGGQTLAQVALSPLDFDSGENETSLLTMKDVMTEYKKILEERMRGEGFYQTGFYHLDKCMTEGFAPRKITTVAARPGCGKSSFVYELARRLANNNIHVFIFT